MLTFAIICVQLWIILSDIRKRRIPNIALILLVLFWCISIVTSPGWAIFQSILPNIFASVIFILYGIFSYQKVTLLGAGDFKYMAILMLFLEGSSLFIFIENIAILTFFLLLLWWSILLWRLVRLRKDSSKWTLPFWKNIARPLLKKYARYFIFEWFIIGFFLSRFVPDFFMMVFQFVPWRGDLYFFISVSLFLLRSKIHYLYTRWKYRLFSIVFIILYFAMIIAMDRIPVFLKDFIVFSQQIFPYALLFAVVTLITKWTFSMLDRVIERSPSKPYFNSFPYSIIIFLAFILSSIGHQSLLALMERF